MLARCKIEKETETINRTLCQYLLLDFIIQSVIVCMFTCMLMYGRATSAKPVLMSQ